jgi:hypothetical protein
MVCVAGCAGGVGRRSGVWAGLFPLERIDGQAAINLEAGPRWWTDKDTRAQTPGAIEWEVTDPQESKRAEEVAGAAERYLVEHPDASQRVHDFASIARASADVLNAVTKR